MQIVAPYTSGPRTGTGAPIALSGYGWCKEVEMAKGNHNIHRPRHHHSEPEAVAPVDTAPVEVAPMTKPLSATVIKHTLAAQQTLGGTPGARSSSTTGLSGSRRSPRTCGRRVVGPESGNCTGECISPPARVVRAVGEEAMRKLIAWWRRHRLGGGSGSGTYARAMLGSEAWNAGWRNAMRR